MNTRVAFPSNKTEALTILFLQKQDLSEITPEQLVEKYEEVHKQISNVQNKNRPTVKTSNIRI